MGGSQKTYFSTFGLVQEKCVTKKQLEESVCTALENASNKVWLFKCVHFLPLPNICIHNSKIAFIV